MAPTLNITPEHFAAAVGQLRRERQYDLKAVQRINTAYVELLMCSPGSNPSVLGREVFQWDGEMLVMPSRTTPGLRYHVQHNGCDCKAGVTGRECWHADALDLLQRAAQYALPPAPKKVYSQQDLDDCF